MCVCVGGGGGDWLVLFSRCTQRPVTGVRSKHQKFLDFGGYRCVCVCGGGGGGGGIHTHIDVCPRKL